jgi:ADP-dependent NAD(P)H-hydrate dehydratase
MPELIVTHEIAPLPERSREAHKGDVGRLIIIGGCNSDTLMIGAPALAANAAFRAGAGLVQMLVPAEIRESVCVLAPCATARMLPNSSQDILRCATDYAANVLAIGPGLGRTLSTETMIQLLDAFDGPCVVDADALNMLAESRRSPNNGSPAAADPRGQPIDNRQSQIENGPQHWPIHDPHRVVLTPHPGEARRLLDSFAITKTIDTTPQSRRAAACALVQATGCTIVLKGHNTVVTNGDRIYTNETGNPGMATAGAGDVLTGVIAALIGQHMPPFEAAVLGVYLHGLAGDFAAEELGRHAMTALDILDYLPEAFIEHESASTA